MKTDSVYKLAFNQMLDLIVAAEKGTVLPSENALSKQLNISRTTVRKVLRQLDERGIVGHQGRGRRVIEVIPSDAHFPVEQTVRPSEQLERDFFEWILRGGITSGSIINEMELARQFNVATTGIREFLNRFSRYGLIEKRANAGWLFKGFTAEFAIELFEIRRLFEMRSALAFSKCDARSPLWSELREIEAAHRRLLGTFEDRFQDFSDLDNRFHRLVNRAAPNRFIDDFYDIITFIFHYHYQWNKQDERLRNRIAIHEHLAYIEALVSRDEARVEAACKKHLESARQTLLAAVSVN